MLDGVVAKAVCAGLAEPPDGVVRDLRDGGRRGLEVEARQVRLEPRREPVLVEAAQVERAVGQVEAAEPVGVLLEIGVRVVDVVRDDVEEHAEAVGVRGIDDAPGEGEVAEVLVDRPRLARPVAVVAGVEAVRRGKLALGRGRVVVERRQPERVDAEVGEVAGFDGVEQALQVAAGVVGRRQEAVRHDGPVVGAVAVAEAVEHDLVDDGVLPDERGRSESRIARGLRRAERLPVEKERLGPARGEPAGRHGDAQPVQPRPA